MRVCEPRVLRVWSISFDFLRVLPSVVLHIKCTCSSLQQWSVLQAGPAAAPEASSRPGMQLHARLRLVVSSPEFCKGRLCKSTSSSLTGHCGSPCTVWTCMQCPRRGDCCAALGPAGGGGGGGGGKIAAARMVKVPSFPESQQHPTSSETAEGAQRATRFQ